MLALIALAALLVPTARTHAMRERTQKTTKAMKERTESLAKWTGNFLSDLGKKIKRQKYAQLPEVVKKYRKTAAGVGALIVIAAVTAMVRLFYKPSAQSPLTPVYETAAQRTAREQRAQDIYQADQLGISVEELQRRREVAAATAAAATRRRTEAEAQAAAVRKSGGAGAVGPSGPLGWAPGSGARIEQQERAAAAGRLMGFEE